MHINVKDTILHNILSPIIESNPEMFETSESRDCDIIILCLRVFYEMTLGQSSYWYPYLRMIPEVESVNNWKQNEMEMI